MSIWLRLFLGTGNLKRSSRIFSIPIKNHISRSRYLGIPSNITQTRKFCYFGLLGSTYAVLNIRMTEQAGQVSVSILNEADKLFEDSKYEDLLELLKRQVGWEDDAEILWRVARCKFQLSKKVKDQKDKHKQLVHDAYGHVKKSLELDDKNGLAHKWAAILLDAVSSLTGTKERVLQVLNVRNHMEKAIEYAPGDATSYYLLGEWHFSCYQVSWWERQLASVAFGKLPDADMEVALKMFEKAEEVEKDFYSKNKVMLAKTLIELKRDKERAIEILKEVVSKYSASSKWDDKEVSSLMGNSYSLIINYRLSASNPYLSSLICRC